MKTVLRQLRSISIGSLLLGLSCPSQAEVAADPYDALYEMVGQAPDGRFIWNGSADEFAKALEGFEGLSQEKVEALSDVRRAILQRMLWAVLDGTDGSGFVRPHKLLRNYHLGDAQRYLIQRKLVSVIEKLALSKQRIRALPNTLAATIKSGEFPTEHDPKEPLKPFLPSNLHDKEGSWVSLQKGDSSGPAKFHTVHEKVKWRSTFLVFMRLPGARKETTDYLKRLSEFRTPWVAEPPKNPILRADHGTAGQVDLYTNPATPQFPVGTQVALIEQAFLISDKSDIVLSPLINSVQLRSYLSIVGVHPESGLQQAFAEFKLRPRELMQGTGSLKPVSVGPREGIRCLSCHMGPGIHSVAVRSEFFVESNRSLRPPILFEEQPDKIAATTAMAKRRDYTWGLLQGILRNKKATQDSAPEPGL